MTAARCLALAVLSSAALAPAALAYQQVTNDQGVPIHWERPCIWWWQQAAGSADVSPEAISEALAAGYATWEEVQGLPLRFQGRGITCFDEVGVASWPGEQNITMWREDEWPYASRVVGLTSVTFDSHKGVIVDADTEFNGVVYRFATDGSPGAYDVQQIATHEIGHLLGLGHSEDPGAVMFARSGAAALDKRVLAPDDVAGVLASATVPTGPDVTPCDPALTVYGLEQPYCPIEPPGSGCGGAGGGGAAATVWMALLALALAGRRRGTRAATLALLIASATPARAGGPYFTDKGDPFHWTASEVAFVVDPDVPKSLTPEGVAEAFDFGSAQWNHVLAGLGPRLRRVGLQDCPGLVVDDRINCFFWTLEASAWLYGSNEVAITLLHYRKSDGEIVDVDMDMNGAQYAWSTGDCVKGMSTYDLAATATHELGHVLGLDHSPATEATMNGVTFPGNCPQRTLAEDDIEAVTALYTAGPETDPDAGDAGGMDASSADGEDATAHDASPADISSGEGGGRATGGCAGGPAAPGLWLLSLIGLAARPRGRRGHGLARARS